MEALGPESDSLDPLKKLGMAGHAVVPALRRQKQVFPWAGWPVSLIQSAVPGPTEKQNKTKQGR